VEQGVIVEVLWKCFFHTKTKSGIRNRAFDTYLEALLLREFAQFVEDKRPIQLQHSGCVMATAHGNSVQKYAATLRNVKLTAEMLNADRFKAKSVGRDQLKDQEWTADNIKTELTEIQCHILPVFMSYLYFTFKRIIGLIYFPHPSRPVLGPIQPKGRKAAEEWP